MKVEYCIHSIHEIDHFESVYHSLHKSGVKCNFVVTSSVSLKEPSRAQTIRSKLLERGLNCQNEADINADVVIGIHGACSLSNYNSFKIKFPYGFYMEKDNHHYAPRGINGYDAALCLGSLQQEYFERSLDSYRCRIIGVPRHDLFFNKAVGFGEVNGLLKSCDPSKKTIAYLPTWGEHCSISYFFHAFSELSSSYNIISRPHHCLLTENMHKKDYLKLKSFSSVTQEVNDPFYAIVRAADIIIVDGKSGAAPEVMLIDESKPIVLLNRVPGGWHLNEMLDIGPIVTNPEDLMNSISSMLAQDEFSKSRALLKKKIYADNYGNAGDIAAQAIIDLSKLPKISGPLKKKIRRHYAWYSKLGRSCLKRMNRYLGTNFKIRDINDIMHFY